MVVLQTAIEVMLKDGKHKTFNMKTRGKALIRRGLINFPGNK